MKALRFSSFGDFTGHLHVEEVPTPVAGPDEVLVKVYAASLNPSDWKNVLGQYKKTVLPRTPGQDVAGRHRRRGQGRRSGRRSGQPAGMWGSRGTVATRSTWSSRKSRETKAEVPVLQRGGLRGKDLRHGIRRADRKAQLQEGETGRHRRKRGRGKLRHQARENEIGPRHRGGPPGAGPGNGAAARDRSGPQQPVGRISPIARGNSPGKKGVNVAFDCVGGPLFEVSLKTLAPGGRQVNIVSVGGEKGELRPGGLLRPAPLAFWLEHAEPRRGGVRRHPGQAAARF